VLGRYLPSHGYSALTPPQHDGYKANSCFSTLPGPIRQTPMARQSACLRTHSGPSQDFRFELRSVHISLHGGGYSLHCSYLKSLLVLSTFLRAATTSACRVEADGENRRRTSEPSGESIGGRHATTTHTY